MSLTPELALQAALRQELHAFAQPLATIQCRLEVALMSGAEADLREAVSGGLADMKTVSESLQRIRSISWAMSSVEAA